MKFGIQEDQSLGFLDTKLQWLPVLNILIQILIKNCFLQTLQI